MNSIFHPSPQVQFLSKLSIPLMDSSQCANLTKCIFYRELSKRALFQSKNSKVNCKPSPNSSVWKYTKIVSLIAKIWLGPIFSILTISLDELLQYKSGMFSLKMPEFRTKDRFARIFTKWDNFKELYTLYHHVDNFYPAVKRKKGQSISIVAEIIGNKATSMYPYPGFVALRYIRTRILFLQCCWGVGS